MRGGLLSTAKSAFGRQMPTRNELLAGHFLKAAGIAAVYVDPAGAIGTVDLVRIDAPSGWALLCCAPGKQIGIATKATARLVTGTDQAAALAALRSVAVTAPWTPHQIKRHHSYGAPDRSGRSHSC
jgi:hypothetical protein